jgi:ribonuclease-3
MSDDPLDACQERIGYRFGDPGLLRAALTHSSCAESRQSSNERLEFLGDAVLGLVVSHELFRRLPQAMEGELTKIKSAVVSRRTCARVAARLGLTEALQCGHGMDVGEQMPPSLAAAALEALVAAIYLDGGFDAARDFILRHMRGELERAMRSDHQFNYKSQLQQYAQKVLGLMPTYDLLDEKGPDHAKCFEVAASIGDRHFPSAWGPSKKEAEQKAAKLALIALGQLPAEREAEADTQT